MARKPKKPAAYEAAGSEPATEKTKKTSKTDEGAICKLALERHQRGVEQQRENTNEAYEDLKFRAGEQWTNLALKARLDRPTLTVNRIPQFIRQVTGDMRQMKPGIKAVPVDSRGDKDTAQTIAGMIRYIENRSDASSIYMTGADSQVTCGIGGWKVIKEYADGTTFNQELRITGIDDQVAVIWDPDAKLPMKEDAKWCIIPVDISRETFKEEYPDASVEDFDDVTTVSADGWFDDDFIRIAEYWVKKPAKRVLALMPDGGVSDLTEKDEAERLEIGKTAKRVEERDSFKVCRYLITACHVLEETDWPGMNIPIIPVIGEEVKIGKRTVRHGLTRFARDPQRMVNYYSSAEAEVIALQPKSPWLATRKNVEQNPNQWATANTEAHSVLLWDPDPKNGNAPPQRVQPPVSSPGISEALDRAVNDMKGVIGIYDAGLGNRSNETSGKAIIARQHEGDVGTIVYVDNWTRSIKRTGAIIIDLLPHVYDTERMIRIMGEDGKVDLKWINKPTGQRVMHPDTGQPTEDEKIENDVTVGAYDVVLESGPSYSTKREEAKESMQQFIQSAPQVAPVIMDLVAKAQDWPLADEIGQRLEAVAPPQVQKLIAKQKKEHGEEEQPDPPTPQEQMAQQATILQLQGLQLDNQKKQAEIAKISSEAQQGQNGGVDPVAMVKARSEQQKMQIEQRKADQEYQIAQQKMAIELQIAQVNLEIALTDLAIKKQGAMIDTASSVQDLQRNQAGMEQDAQRHAQTLTHGAQSHDQTLTQGAEMQAAKVKQMSGATT